MSQIKAHYFQQIERQQLHDRGLAGEFWPDQQPILAIPIAHFGGTYPAAPTAPKVCKIRGFVSGVGNTAVKWGRAEFSQWRGYTHPKSGRYIQPCQHCRHERVLETCEHIERASFQYSQDNLMRWQSVTQAEKNKQTAVIRKRKERGAALASPVTFPLSNGRFILLHDAPDIGGQPLPSDRRELYHLVAGWVLDTPKGKRAGKGLATWGKQPDKPAGAAGGEKPTKEGQPEGKRWRLLVDNFSTLAREMAAYEGKPVKPGEINIPVSEIVARLDNAGAVWAVESGELPANVTLNREEEKPICVKCDNPPGGADLTAVFSHSQGDLQSENEPKPAPIYLNGEWVE